MDERYVNLTIKREIKERVQRLAEKYDVPMTKIIERAIALLEKFDEFIEEYGRRI